ncbi:hypothetical protein [Sphingobium scionense]|uniref:hypothetical protein n=1 Tax=Sphingobium scionense TaxID=1404341 RepID=UPI0035F0C1F7
MRRPVLIPVDSAPAASQGASLAAPAGEARGTQYFEAHLDEAREIVVQCAAGTVRGQECANAEIAIAEADGKARFDAFMGNRNSDRDSSDWCISDGTSGCDVHNIH